MAYYAHIDLPDLLGDYQPICLMIRENHCIRTVRVSDYDGGRFSSWTSSPMNATCRARGLDFRETIGRLLHPLTHHAQA